MRYLRKRVTCVNRGNEGDNQTAINKIKQRYIAKMALRGWIHTESTEDAASGDSMMKYEAYFTIMKPSANSK